MFKVGEKVYIIPDDVCYLGPNVRSHYPNKIAKIIRIDDGGIPIRLKTTDGTGNDWGFVESDLSPIFHYEGEEYVWKGEERRPKKGERFLDGLGSPLKAHGDFISTQYKILKPITEDKMFNEPVIPIEDFESPKPKYKILDLPITVETLSRAGACEPTLSEFMAICIKQGYRVTAEIPADAAQRIAVEMGYLTWLPDHGFIAQAEEEQFYHVGQKFKDDDCFPDCVWMITSYDSKRKASLVCVEGKRKGQCYDGRLHDVKDADKITQAEFKQITGNNTDFHLIES